MLLPVIERELPTDEARALLDLAREIAAAELAPRVDAAEAAAEFPRDVYRTLGDAGLLGLAYPEEHGGGGQPYAVYLQALEELARAWLSVGIGVSVHTLACFPLAQYGTAEQKERWLPEMLGGTLLGAYCLSEPGSGSDAAALVTRAVPDGDDVRRRRGQGVDHPWGRGRLLQPDGPDLRRRPAGDHLPARRGRHARAVGGRPRAQDGRRTPRPRRRSSSTARGSRPTRRMGAEGEGFKIALGALDGGRLGIAACAVGLAQAALDLAASYAKERRQFGRPIGEFQGLSFLLADMATSVSAARALYLDAARLRDRGGAFGPKAAMAKLFATDTAMRVTTDAVQVLGGYGYVQDFAAERYMREAKVLQIVEGTNQIQRVVIGRSL